MPVLLIVDDEPNVLYSLEKGLRREDLEILTAETATRGIELVRERRPDAAILDVRLPDMSGLDAFQQLLRIDPRLPVVIITAFASTDTAIEAMKRGAYEYLLKPVDFHQLRGVVARAVELSRLRRVPALYDQSETDVAADRIVGRSRAMQDVYKAIGRVAPQDVAVLILGESGTGKELVARAIYHHSGRSEAPFLAMNCAAIPDSLLESELFGHERGAFTGADRLRIGKFEQADGGTIFLDELGDMSGATQSKLLRVLQDGSFERVGGNQTYRTDVRVIAATNRDLEAMAADGEFRKDLFYRLNVFTIRLPALRERLEDLPLLVEYFLQSFSRDLGQCVPSVTEETMEALRRYDWPGNVRELQSAVKFALLHAVGDVLTPDCLPEWCRRSSTNENETPIGAGRTDFDLAGFIRQLLRTGESDVYRRAQAELDRILLKEVLNHVGGNQVQASEILGISRTTLRAKLSNLGMSIEKHLLADSDRGTTPADET